jgi:asparagine synthase (glutamine-hydrolysing)
MCGIVGIWSASGRPTSLSAELTARMAQALAHRGPDQQGAWAEPVHGLHFAHRRLSIIDVSPSGHQPMTSANGRWTICFNGEIYNAERLRPLIGCPAGGWRGHSDTEVLLESIAKWGLRTALEKSIGMFALAVWDRQTRTLFLARDRTGEKPLYYGRSGTDFLFASELKAMRAHPDMQTAIHPEALRQYLYFGYVPAPYSIYDGVSKLLPGHIAVITDSGASITLTPYWQAPLANPDPALEDDNLVALELNALLGDAVGLQMRSDMPMGAFLSGGVDSSLIVALMQRNASRPVRTYSIGFGDTAFNEAPYASAVARHLGTEHNELEVGERDCLALVGALPQIYDEPFADSSQIPSILLARFTRQAVTVALSGDAGDELFGGYTRYTQIAQFGALHNKIPLPLRNMAGWIMRLVPDAVLEQGRRHSPAHLRDLFSVQRWPKVIAALEASNTTDIYRSMIAHWTNPPLQNLSACSMAAPNLPAQGDMDILDWMMRADFLGYLPDDILTKVDRASMSASLEVRVPYLDHRVIELAARLPRRQKIRDGQGKYCLRTLLYQHVPRKLIDRTKQGFAVPLGRWLRSSLRDWGEALLSVEALEAAGLDARTVRAQWQEHQAGQVDASARLWTILMLLSWHVQWNAPPTQRLSKH